MSSERILVVDDELEITRVLKGTLSAKGYQVRTANDGTAAFVEFKNWKPHLVITDLSMPKMNGLVLCESIRSLDLTPIIVLSVRDDEAVKVQALEVGADDYVTKPFGMEELLARVKATLRRASPTQIQSNILQAGPFRMDIAAHKCEISGREIYLTPKEFELLVYFLKNAGKVITHKNLLLDLWERAHSDDPDVVRVLVRQLRKKIEPNPSDPTYLKTEPWIGYRFETGE